MSLFQSTVLTKYLNNQDTSILRDSWQAFKKHFHNPEIKENIRNSKEEQYQGEFLIDLFVEVLGYTKNPSPNFNITTEYKNVKDSKKADGAILIDDEVIAVIELKGTETTDLNKIEAQAFGYKNNQPSCRYVITSNFEKLRFYIDNTIDFIEFNLFELSESQFKTLYLCLGFKNLSVDLPAKVKSESVSQEDTITKQLYKDYSQFKRELFNNLVEGNPQYDSLSLFKKSQKLLDRFLFLFFAEDRLLLPPNSIRLILKQWQKLQELDEYVPLYDRFKKYFGYLNTGYKGKQYDVFAYNGGLFKPDDILDTLTIDDDLLYKHTLKLSEYNFESEVDVNILGHIFENSLNEIEEIQAELEGQEVDKSKTKRKKDGVFYTPKYITKYIVENTVGKLCEEKKQELEITDENYQPAKQRSRKRLENLQAYRDWLLNITICDPACGSGAFLNQALEFLIEEHRYIDELSAKYNRDSLILSDVENSILENNLFGVDLNEEAVEIAKLSLWLRTAQKNRKLNDLSNNIKCGNSLIDDPEVSGDKAFRWEEEFPDIFDGGGFDVVIGNPPYVFTRTGEFASKAKDYILNYVLERSISTTSKGLNIQKGKINLFAIFLIKGLELINDNGLMSYIIPNNILRATPYEAIRKFLLEKSQINEILDLGKGVFDDATVSTVIMSFSKGRTVKHTKILKNIKNLASGEYDVTYLEQGTFLKNKQYVLNILVNQIDIEIIEKLEATTTLLGEFFKYISPGIDGSKDKYVSKVKESDDFKPLLFGKSFGRYFTRPIDNYILYDRELLNRARKEEIFLSNKIIIQRISGGLMPLTGTIDLEKNYTFNSVNNLVTNKNYESFLNYFLGVINSRLINWYYALKFSNRSNLTVNISKTFLQILPIKDPNDNIQIAENINKSVKNILDANNRLKELENSFTRLISRKFDLEDFSEMWHKLSFKEFVHELNRHGKNVGLREEAEWEEYFLEEQQKAKSLKARIEMADNEIDQIVYELYGLTEEEIKMIEQNT